MEKTFNSSEYDAGGGAPPVAEPTLGHYILFYVLVGIGVVLITWWVAHPMLDEKSTFEAVISRGFFICFCLMPFLMGCAGLFLTFLYLPAKFARCSRANTSGKIVKSEIVTANIKPHEYRFRQQPDTPQNMYADIEYEYEVDGRVYRHDNVRPIEDTGVTLSYVGTYPVGTEVIVYYNPENPQEATLIPTIPRVQGQVRKMSFAFLILGLVLAALFGSGWLI